MKRALKQKLIERAKQVARAPSARKLLLGAVGASLALLGVNLSPETQENLNAVLAVVAQVL